MKHRRRTSQHIELLLMSIPDYAREIQVPIGQFSLGAKKSTLPEGNTFPWQHMLVLQYRILRANATISCVSIIQTEQPVCSLPVWLLHTSQTALASIPRPMAVGNT
jgi:hypothetical protein